MTTEEAAKKLATVITGCTEDGAFAKPHMDPAAAHKAAVDALMDFARTCLWLVEDPPVDTTRADGT